MARRNERAYLRGLEVSLKKYLYVLRPPGGSVGGGHRPPPMRFEALGRQAAGREGAKRVDLLLELKRSGLEMARGPRWPVLDRYVARELDSLDAGEPSYPYQNKTDERWMRSS